MLPYPAMLYIEEWAAVIIGGGKIATRKAKRLLESGAKVTVVSPELSPELQSLAEQRRIVWRAKNFEAADIEEAFIVIAASDHQEVNQLAAESAKKTQLVNIVDDPNLGNFHVPASFHQGKLSIAIATGGASPFLSKNIRDSLKRQFAGFDAYLEFLEEVRSLLQKTERFDARFKAELLREVTTDAYRLSPERQRSLLSILRFFKETDDCV